MCKMMSWDQMFDISHAFLSHIRFDMVCVPFDAPAAVPSAPVSLLECDVGRLGLDERQHGGCSRDGHDTASAMLSRP